MPYLLDLRTRVAAVCCGPKTRQTQVAQRLGVSRWFVRDLLRHERETGSLAPNPASGGPRRLVSADEQVW